MRRTSRFILLGVVAAIQALEDSGLDINKEAHQIGVEVGSGIGGIEILEKYHLNNKHFLNIMILLNPTTL